MAEIIVSSLQILLALFLVGLNGFFVASEFAFVRIRESTVDRLYKEDRYGSSILKEVMNDLDDYLAVTQLGITVASIGLGWVGEPAIASLLEGLLSGYISSSVLHIISFSIGFGTITFLHVVIGELAPKTFSIQKTEKICLIVAPPMKFFRILFKPGIYVFNGSANKLTKLFGVEPASEANETYTEEELRNVINQSSDDGQVDSSEVDMIERVFELDDFKVKDVMAPRPDTVVVYNNDKISEIVKKVKENTHTRYPVIDEEDESISGYVDIKDIFTEDNTGKTHIRDIKEDINIISESANIRRAIKEFKENNTQMLAVVDEWGVFEGIITVEDAIEVLVGDIRDKYDKDHKVPLIEEKGDGVYISDGSVSVRRINKVIGTSFDSANSDTIAGVILNQTETIPNVGDTINLNQYEISVEKIEDNRIQKVKISKID